MEADDEIKGTKNSYDFGARLYDPRVGRWLSGDAKEKDYPNLSPFTFVNGMVISAIDPDGNDIIILNAPSGAQNLGHGAILIGNDTDGWKLYSKNGTADHGPSGPTHFKDVGVEFGSLKEFANSSQNFHESGDPYYTGAYRISSTSAQDKKMAVAAKIQIEKDYQVLNASCQTVCNDALKAGGFDPGLITPIFPDPGSNGEKRYSVMPNENYRDIKSNNKGVDVSSEIIPDQNVMDLEKKANQAEYSDPPNYSNDSDNTIVRNANIAPLAMPSKEKSGAIQQLNEIRKK